MAALREKIGVGLTKIIYVRVGRFAFVAEGPNSFLFDVST